MSFRHQVVVTVSFLFAIGLAVLAFTPAAVAQEPTGDQPQAGEPSQAGSTGGDESEEGLTRRERKLQAKEKRIEEYLRKKEEKRARKEQARLEREEKQREEAARDLEAEQLASATPPAPSPVPTPEPAARTRPAPAPTKTAKAKNPAKQRSTLPRGLARAQANVRSTDLGLDPTVQEYLALIDRQQASAHQLAAFGNFLAQNGLTRDGLQYYEVALSLEQRDPVLWINAGTLHQQLKDYSTAESAYVRALGLDPNNALAHYNLGSVLDQMNRYDDALAEYKAALFLDPTLGDPAINPQATNNSLLTAVKLMLYQEQVGSLSLPLIDVPPAGQNADSQARSE